MQHEALCGGVPPNGVVIGPHIRHPEAANVVEKSPVLFHGVLGIGEAAPLALGFEVCGPSQIDNVIPQELDCGDFLVRADIAVGVEAIPGTVNCDDAFGSGIFRNAADFEAGISRQSVPFDYQFREFRYGQCNFHCEILYRFRVRCQGLDLEIWCRLFQPGLDPPGDFANLILRAVAPRFGDLHGLLWRAHLFKPLQDFFLSGTGVTLKRRRAGATGVLSGKDPPVLSGPKAKGIVFVKQSRLIIGNEFQPELVRIVVRIEHRFLEALSKQVGRFDGFQGTDFGRANLVFLKHGIGQCGAGDRSRDKDFVHLAPASPDNYGHPSFGQFEMWRYHSLVLY